MTTPLRLRIFATVAVLAVVVAGLPVAPAAPPPGRSAGPETAALRSALQEARPGEVLPVLATFTDAAAPAGRARLDAAGVPVRHLQVLPVSAAALTADQVRAVASWPEVRRLHLDLPLRFDLNRSAPAVAAPQAWNGLGETGRNATVLVIDTGVDATHPDLAARTTALVAAPGPGGPTAVPAPATDGDGHGTHVAGIVAGNGTALGPAVPLLHRRFVGVAPEARVVSFGVGAGGRLFQALQGLDWAIVHHHQHGIRVVSNSWSIPGGGVGGGFDPEGEVEQATLRLYRAGVAVVFAAGNSGPEPNTLNPLAMPPWVLAVGATTSQRTVADFSGRGVDAGAVLTWSHPDLMAPGTGVMSARAAGTTNPERGPAYCPDAPGTPAEQLALVPGEHDLPRLAASALYTCASGTSMATPHVAGAAALMVSANPALSPDQVYDLLLATAAPLPYAPWEAGAGFLDAGAAVAAALAAPGQRDAFLAGQRAYEGAACMADDALARLRHARGQGPAPCSAASNVAPFAPAVFTALRCASLPGLPGIPGPDAGIAGQPVALGVFGLLDFEGGPLRVRVDWGDGQVGLSPPAPSDMACPGHAYAAPGTYPVEVRAVDDAGAVGAPHVREVRVIG